MCRNRREGFNITNILERREMDKSGGGGSNFQLKHILVPQKINIYIYSVYSEHYTVPMGFEPWAQFCQQSIYTVTKKLNICICHGMGGCYGLCLYLARKPNMYMVHRLGFQAKNQFFGIVWSAYHLTCTAVFKL